MADLIISAAEVQPGIGDIDSLTAGDFFNAGDVGYKKVSDGKAYHADANLTAAEAEVLGVAVNYAAGGQRVNFQKNGPVTLGATASPVQGETYALSETAGKIAPVSDLITTDTFISIIGVGNDSDGIDLDINNSGIQVP